MLSGEEWRGRGRELSEGGGREGGGKRGERERERVKARETDGEIRQTKLGWKQIEIQTD